MYCAWDGLLLDRGPHQQEKKIGAVRWIDITVDYIDGEIARGVEGAKMPAEVIISARFGAGLAVGIGGCVWS